MTLVLLCPRERERELQTSHFSPSAFCSIAKSPSDISLTLPQRERELQTSHFSPSASSSIVKGPSDISLTSAPHVKHDRHSACKCQTSLPSPGPSRSCPQQITTLEASAGKSSSNRRCTNRVTGKTSCEVGLSERPLCCFGGRGRDGSEFLLLLLFLGGRVLEKFNAQRILALGPCGPM